MLVGSETGGGVRFVEVVRYHDDHSVVVVPGEEARNVREHLPLER